MSTRTLLAALLIFAPTAGAQAPQATQVAANPMSAALQRSFGTVADYIVRSAEQFPEEKYGFQATPDIRTFAREIAHVTDAHFAYCSRARGETSPQQGRLENVVTEKSPLIAKLKESVAYCRNAYAMITDGMLGESIQVGTATGLRLTALVTNIGHDNEHYGKIVTYLRMNGLVPPSSAR